MKDLYFNNLTEKDFERFSADILSYDLGIPFRAFKGYKDKGIDALCLDEEKNWIGQAKFFRYSSKSTMMSNLKVEALKVQKIKPDRYFLCIGRELLESEFEEILNLFSPYLKKKDIYDEIIIRDILEKKDAEYLLEKWDKLWLPSPYFAEKFYKKFKKSKYVYSKKDIVDDSKIFVETKNYHKALRILEEKNIVLIHGEPGAGKTTLARRLALKYIIKNYDFIYENANNLGDIEDYLYDGNNRVILVDDFLGQSTFQLNSMSDNKLSTIISYAKRHDNVKLILTTRTYIYNNARQIFEKFDDISKSIENLLIEVKEYSDNDKKQILYNHLYYQGLLFSAEYVEIVRKRYYNDIIYNKNFTPRNVAKICKIIEEDRPENVIETVNEYLNNPDNIWEHEYRKVSRSELGKYEKIILDLICFSLADMTEEILKEEFRKLVKDDEYENDIFYDSIKELTNAFIKITFNDKEKIYSILNPSMEDFLKSKLKNDPQKLQKYIDSIDNINTLYDICLHFTKEPNIQESIIQKVKALLNSGTVKESDNEHVYAIFDINHFEDKNIIEGIIDNAFEHMNDENAALILRILKFEGRIGYDYCFEKFQEYEVRRKETKYSLFFCLNDVFDINDYFGVCSRIFRKKDSKHMMDIVEPLVDKLIYYLTVAGTEILYDQIEYVIAQQKCGVSMDEICDDYARDEIDYLENMYYLYTDETIDFIIGDVLCNHGIYISEEELEKEKVKLKLSQKENDEYENNIDVFENVFQHQDELLDYYFRKNIFEEAKVKWVTGNKDKWFLKEFIEDNAGLKLITEAINSSEIIPENPAEFGDMIISYLDSNHDFYVENLANIVDLSNKMFMSEDKKIDLSEKEIKWEVIKRLEQDNILVEFDDGIEFARQFYQIYFIDKSIKLRKTFLRDYFGHMEPEEEIKIFNILSYENLGLFNLAFIKNRIDYYTTHIRGRDKMSIVKSLIRKLSPRVIISKSSEDSIVHKFDSFFAYIGLDIVGGLDADYSKIEKFLKKKYPSRRRDLLYEIKMEEVIKDEESIKVFHKLKIWDNLYNSYLKLLELSKRLENEKDIDCYLYFQDGESKMADR